METLEFTRDGDIAWLRMNRPDKLNSFTVQMWNEIARARAGGQGRPDDPRARRHRQRTRVLVWHRHVGVHRRRWRLRRALVGRARHPRRPVGRGDPARPGLVHVVRRSAVSHDRGRPRLRTRRGPAARAGLRHPRVRARCQRRAARAQVRHPPGPGRHAAAATRRRRGQGQGDDLDGGAHRCGRGVPHRLVRTARRRR